jgi:DNA-binding PadR family transcriptional regulator
MLYYEEVLSIVPVIGEVLPSSEKLEAMRLELRRGILILAVLNALKQEQYGYSLRKALQAVDIDIEEGTLYPLVRRLESYGLLDSRWSSEEGRKRRYYQTSPKGIETLLALQTDWQQLNKSLAKISEANK